MRSTRSIVNLSLIVGILSGLLGLASGLVLTSKRTQKGPLNHIPASRAADAKESTIPLAKSSENANNDSIAEELLQICVAAEPLTETRRMEFLIKLRGYTMLELETLFSRSIGTPFPTTLQKLILQETGRRSVEGALDLILSLQGDPVFLSDFYNAAFKYASIDLDSIALLCPTRGAKLHALAFCKAVLTQTYATTPTVDLAIKKQLLPKLPISDGQRSTLVAELVAIHDIVWAQREPSQLMAELNSTHGDAALRATSEKLLATAANYSPRAVLKLIAEWPCSENERQHLLGSVLPRIASILTASDINNCLQRLNTDSQKQEFALACARNNPMSLLTAANESGDVAYFSKFPDASELFDALGDRGISELLEKTEQLKQVAPIEGALIGIVAEVALEQTPAAFPEPELLDAMASLPKGIQNQVFGELATTFPGELIAHALSVETNPALSKLAIAQLAEHAPDVLVQHINAVEITEVYKDAAVSALGRSIVEMQPDQQSNLFASLNDDLAWQVSTAMLQSSFKFAPSEQSHWIVKWVNATEGEQSPQEQAAFTGAVQTIFKRSPQHAYECIEQMRSLQYQSTAMSVVVKAIQETSGQVRSSLLAAMPRSPGFEPIRRELAATHTPQ
jgi:hypothetical protein